LLCLFCLHRSINIFPRSFYLSECEILTARLVDTRLLGFLLFWGVTVYVIRCGKGPTDLSWSQTRHTKSGFEKKEQKALYFFGWVISRSEIYKKNSQTAPNWISVSIKIHFLIWLRCHTSSFSPNTLLVCGQSLFDVFYLCFISITPSPLHRHSLYLP
jgi:hypothetical protein